MFVDLVQNDKQEDGNYTSTFYKIKLSDKLLEKYKELIKVSNNIYVEGRLNNYIRNKEKIYYIFPRVITKLDEKYQLIESNIEYDSDGVMLWNGKRCEVIEPTPEEVEEMENILNI